MKLKKEQMKYGRVCLEIVLENNFLFCKIEKGFEFKNMLDQFLIEN